MKYLIVSMILGGVVVLMWLFPHTMLSPGELLQGHQPLNNDCFACHAPFGGLPDSKCASCHAPAEIEKNMTVHFAPATGKYFMCFLSCRSSGNSVSHRGLQT
jgi:hypothetical protein